MNRFGFVRRDFALGLGFGLGCLLVIFALSVEGLQIPNTPALFVLAIAFAAFKAGTVAGITCNAVMLIYSVFLFSEPGTLLQLSHASWLRFGVLAVVGPAIAAIVGKMRHELEAFRSAEVRERLQHYRSTQELNTQLQDSKRALEEKVLTRTSELKLALASMQKESLSRKLIASQLEVEHQRLESVLEQMPAGAVIAEPVSGRVLFCNQLARDLLGEAHIDINSLDKVTELSKFINQNGDPVQPETWPLFRAAEAGESIQDEIFRFSDNLGRSRFIRVNAAPIRNSSQQIVAAVATFFDVSLDFEREEQLRQAKLLAEEGNRAKSAFLANCSHEIRTPLNAIMGFVELIRSGDYSPAEQNEYLDIILRNSSSLAQIIDDILDLSKIESGHFTITRRPVVFSRVIDEVVSLLSVKAKQKNIDIIIESSPDVVDRVMTDEVRLRQILVNIIGNAVKFTSRGYVKVKVGNGGAGILAIEVQDTGIGIPFDKQDRLFRIFSQVDDGATRVHGGSGLGLVLSKRLAQAIGGDVILKEAEPGVGSTFLITIDTGLMSSFGSRPVVDSKAETAPDALVRGVRVLIAEDSTDGQTLLSRMLGKQGAKVDFVDNGRDAIERAMAGNYDVVLMDIQMPLVNGYEATKALRDRGYSKPIVALTAHALKEERERSLNQGCDDHLTKPIDTKQLLRTLSRFARPTTHCEWRS